jgi:hypothetical protein
LERGAGEYYECARPHLHSCVDVITGLPTLAALVPAWHLKQVSRFSID